MATTASNWLETALGRLQEDRFSVQRDVAHDGQSLAAVAHRSRFELAKFGNCETFFVFRELTTADESAIRAASAASFAYAKSNKSCPLPCGLFETVQCFSVCIVPNLDPATAEAIRTVAPGMKWAAAEVPVVYDSSTNQVCYFEKTPMWGAAYYKGFRKMIQSYLS